MAALRLKEWILLAWMLYMTAMGTLAMVFAFGVMHKLKDFSRFKASLAAYRLVPSPLLPLLAPLVVVLELAAIAAILLPVGPGVTIAFGLLLVYTLALLVNLLRGNTLIDCGCGDLPTPISGWLLLRNGALLLLAVPHEHPTGSADLIHWALVAVVVAILAVVYLLIEQLLANQALLAVQGD